MEIKLTIKKHEEEVQLPFEAKMEISYSNEFAPQPSYSSQNEFFEDEELAKGYLLESLAEEFKIGFVKKSK